MVEFAPGDTPRSVESPGTAALGHDHAMALLRTVYGFTPGLDGRPGERVEFSIHPLAAGVRQAHTILWERERVDPVSLAPRLTWPNRFSRLLGDKAFGLLVADLLGLPVPATTVVGRRVAPFSFGRPTGSGERWLRTCPAEPVPGRFPTQRGWRDPFALLAAEDPSGADVVAVLAQEGVGARWSGAALPDAGGGLLVEGVPGFGEDFMLARAAPGPLPDRVVDDVRQLGARAAAALGPVRFEWSHDGARRLGGPAPPGHHHGHPHHDPPGHPGPLAPVRPGSRPRAAARPDRHRRPRGRHRAHRRRRRHLPRRRPPAPSRDPVQARPPGLKA